MTALLLKASDSEGNGKTQMRKWCVVNSFWKTFFASRNGTRTHWPAQQGCFSWCCVNSVSLRNLWHTKIRILYILYKLTVAPYKVLHVDSCFGANNFSMGKKRLWEHHELRSQCLYYLAHPLVPLQWCIMFINSKNKKLIFKNNRNPMTETSSTYWTNIYYKNKSGFQGFGEEWSHFTQQPRGGWGLSIDCGLWLGRACWRCASVILRAVRGKKGVLLLSGAGAGNKDSAALQFFLCHSVKTLQHTVCSQTCLWVMVPAFCNSGT